MRARYAASSRMKDVRTLGSIISTRRAASRRASASKAAPQGSPAREMPPTNRAWASSGRGGISAGVIIRSAVPSS